MAKNPDDRFASAVELARALKFVVDESLAGQANQIVPFAGLIIEHQHVSNLAATQELQRLAKKSTASEPITPSSIRIIGRKVAFLVVASLLGFLVTSFCLQDDLLSNQVKSTAGVPRQSSIQRQYALAMINNDLSYWTLVSEYYKPVDSLSRVYELKSKLQIARLEIEGGNYDFAARTLLDVLNSKYSEAVILTIATIEMGYVSKKIPGEMIRPKFYEEATGLLALLDQNNRKLVRDSLPSIVREDWDRKVLSLQENTSPPD